MPKDLTLHGPRWCHAGMSRVDPEHQPPEICGEAESPCHDAGHMMIMILGAWRPL